ncbi:MAG: hypothetical protein WD294_01855 [Phycisphaeraceae bacterium]
MEPEAKQQQALTTARIIWAGLLGGTLMIMAVFAMLLSDGEPREADAGPGLFFIIAVAITAGGIGMSFVIPALFKKKVWQHGLFDADMYNMTQIGGMAPLEGAAVASLALAMVDGSMIPLGIVAMVPMAVLLSRFPKASDTAAPTEATAGTQR